MDELDALAEQAQPLAAPSSSQETGAVTVAPPSDGEDNDCQMCEKQPAAQWCENCEKWMCDSCEAVHSQVRHDSRHKIRSRDDVKQSFNEAMTQLAATLQGKLHTYDVAIAVHHTVIRSSNKCKYKGVDKISKAQERIKKEIDEHFNALKEQAMKSMDKVRDTNEFDLDRMTQEANNIHTSLDELQRKVQNEKYLTNNMDAEESNIKAFVESLPEPTQPLRMPEIRLRENPQWAADCAQLEIAELLPEQPALTACSPNKQSDSLQVRTCTYMYTAYAKDASVLYNPVNVRQRLVCRQR